MRTVVLVMLCGLVLPNVVDAQPLQAPTRSTAISIRTGPQFEVAGNMGLWIDTSARGSGLFGAQFTWCHTEWLASEISYDKASAVDRRTLLAALRWQLRQPRGSAWYLTTGLARVSGTAYAWSPEIAVGFRGPSRNGIAFRLELQRFARGTSDRDRHRLVAGGVFEFP